MQVLMRQVREAGHDADIVPPRPSMEASVKHNGKYANSAEHVAEKHLLPTNVPHIQHDMKNLNQLNG